MKQQRSCPKGHLFYKSSNCPSCPVCEQELKPTNSFLALLGAPARHALASKEIVTLQQLANYTEAEILSLHGVGKSSIPILRSSLKDVGLSFKKSSSLKKIPMTAIHAYLTFSGNCREAMNFYKDCLGGELHLQTIGESPLAGKMPAQMKECILHATLIKDGLVLMGSDMVADKGLTKGNNVSMAIHCSSKDEIEKLYEKLSLGGFKDHALEQSFWGVTFGDLTDQYGNHWLLHYEKKNKEQP